MLNRSASLAMSTCVLKALPGKLDIKRHSPSILYSFSSQLSLKFHLIIKTKVLTDEGVSRFNFIRCCIYHANCCHLNIYEQDKCLAYLNGA